MRTRTGRRAGARAPEKRFLINEIFRDAPNADVEPAKYVHEKKVVKAGDKFAVHMAPGGGFVVKFTKK